MCIDFYGDHSDGSSFVYVNDFCYYRNCLYTHRYKFSSEKKKKKRVPDIYRYMVSHPEIGSDPPIRSDRESGCDTVHIKNVNTDSKYKCIVMRGNHPVRVDKGKGYRAINRLNYYDVLSGVEGVHSGSD